MSIQYAGGTNVHSSIDGSNATTCVDEIKAALVTAGWSVSSGSSGDWTLLSATTPSGLLMKARVYVSSSHCHFTFSSSDGTATSQDFGIVITGTRVYKIIANKYQFFIYLEGVTVGSGSGVSSNFVATGVPYLPAQVQPTAVTAASNTSPIVITSTSHGLTTGETAYIQGVAGNTAANGEHQVTVLTANTFELDGTTGSGAYTSGGYVGGPRKISRCIWAMANTNSGGGCWRTDLSNDAGLDNAYFVTVNQNYWADSAGASEDSIPVIPEFASAPGLAATWYGLRYVLQEAIVRVGTSVPTTTLELTFQLWDGAVINNSFTVDTEDTFDSHNWHLINADNPGLWIVIP